MDDLIGKPILRVEDERLLTGNGSFTDDLRFEGELFACFVRTPYAHARISFYRRLQCSKNARCPHDCDW